MTMPTHILLIEGGTLSDEAAAKLVEATKDDPSSIEQIVERLELPIGVTAKLVKVPKPIHLEEQYSGNNPCRPRICTTSDLDHTALYLVREDGSRSPVFVGPLFDPSVINPEGVKHMEPDPHEEEKQGYYCGICNQDPCVCSKYNLR